MNNIFDIFDIFDITKSGLGSGGKMPTDNLVGWWKFDSDNLTGSTFDNLASIATTYDGVSRNVPTLTTGRKGEANGAMVFNGVEDITGDVVTLGTRIADDVTTWSFGCWITAYTAVGSDYFVGEAASLNIFLNRDSGFGFRDGAGTSNKCGNTSLITAAGYHLLVITANGTNLKGYVNGILQNTVTPSATTFRMLKIGNGYSTEANKPACTLSEAFYYDDELTIEEIKVINNL